MSQVGSIVSGGSGGEDFTWQVVNKGTLNAEPNNGYIVISESNPPLEATINFNPTNASIGDLIIIQKKEIVFGTLIIPRLAPITITHLDQSILPSLGGVIIFNQDFTSIKFRYWGSNRWVIESTTGNIDLQQFPSIPTPLIPPLPPIPLSNPNPNRREFVLPEVTPPKPILPESTQ